MTDDAVPGQLPLFAGAKPAAPPRRARAAQVSYARFKPAQRTSCDDCRTRLHQLGVARAPFPRPARWRRTAPDTTTTVLCDACKNERKGAGQ